MWRYPYFSQEEMTCKCGCGGLPKDAIMQVLVTMREEAGFPLSITSGYRCPARNVAVSKSGIDGPHTTGFAVDIGVFGIQAHEVVRLALKHGIPGLGVKQLGPIKERFIHLDIIKPGGKFPRPWIWSY